MFAHLLPPFICRIALLLLLAPVHMHAQEGANTVAGTVTDRSTDSVLASVNIRIAGSTRGTTSNAGGSYQIQLPSGCRYVIFSCIGYCTDTVDLSSGTPHRLDISLQPAVLAIEEVTVVAEGLNPAESIIRKAIRKKCESDIDLKAYAFKVYTKTTLRLPGEQDGTADTIIAGLQETQSNGYWEQPDRYKEIITARRQSANLAAGQNIFTIGRPPNLNDNQSVIGQLSVVGPTAPEALDNYSFEMLDTLVTDGTRIFRLRMTPKSTTRPLFAGVISIADESFRVMQVDVDGNEALDVPPFEKLHIRQQFSLYEEKYWLPIESSMDFRVQLAIPSIPPILWRQASFMSDYEFGQRTRDVIFDEHLISALPLADRQDSSTWASSAVLPLTDEEQTAYHKLDSLMTNAGLLARSVLFFSKLPVTLRRLPLAEVSDFFHFNRVEGAYLGAGLDLSCLNDLTNGSLAGGYGIADKVWKYSIRIEQYSSSSRDFSFGTEIHRSMRYKEVAELFGRGTITLLALLDKSDPADYFLAEGFSLFSHYKPLEDLTLGLSYLDEREASVTKRSEFSVLQPSKTFRFNPPIQDGRYRSIAASLMYDTRKFVDAGLAETVDESRDATLLSCNAEFAGKAIARSPADYQRYLFGFRRYQHGPGPGRLMLSSTLGVSEGGLPVQREFSVQGKVGGIAPIGVFKCARTDEFAGRRLATLQLEYNLGVQPFRSLGLSFARNLELIFYSGTAWCSRNAWSMASPEIGKGDERALYQEAGFAIGKLLTFFRLDFTWRLTYRTGDDFTLTLGSALF